METVLIVWDGLRPEFVRPDLTPSLCELENRGVTFRKHLAIFPTETRVNSSSIATGRLPVEHGIVANRFWDRSITGSVNTGDENDLTRLAEDTGRVLPVPTVVETLEKAGVRSMVVGAGSPGSTLLQSPDGFGTLVNTRSVVRPEERREAFTDRYGGFPGEESAPDGWNDLACRIFADGARSGDYGFGILWLCDPDYTQHKQGLGSQDSLASIRKNDKRLRELLGTLPKPVNIILASDHGFSTVDPDKRPRDRWLDWDPERAWFGSSGIYLAEPERDLEGCSEIVRAQPWIGPVFTTDSGGGESGVVEGTFSKDLIGLEHAVRSPDIVYSRRWTDERNGYGVAGKVWGAGGIATHGSLSPFDRRAVLICSGSDFEGDSEPQTVSSAIDIAPTILSLFGLEPDLPGRVLEEAKSSGTQAATRETREVSGVGAYTVATLGEHSYIESFEV